MDKLQPNGHGLYFVFVDIQINDSMGAGLTYLQLDTTCRMPKHIRGKSVGNIWK